MYNLYMYACRASVQFVQEHAEVGPDEIVVIDPAAVTFSRRESQLMRSSGEPPKISLLSPKFDKHLQCHFVLQGTDCY